MLCCPHCSMLSTILLTILFSIVTPDSSSKILFNIVENYNNVSCTTLFNPVFYGREQVIIFAV